MTPRQERLWHYLLARRDDAVQPTLQQMATHLGLGSKSAAARMIAALEAEGRVVRTGGKRRCYRAVAADPFAGVSTSTIIEALRSRGVEINART